MFSINSGILNNNYVIIIFSCIVIIYLLTDNINNSSCSLSSIKLIQDSQKDKEYIKEIMFKQEKILLDLQNKIKKKLAKKNIVLNTNKKTDSRTNLDTTKTDSRINVIPNITKDKLNTIENLDDSIKPSKTPSYKNNQPENIESTDNSSHDHKYPKFPSSPYYNPLKSYPIIPTIHRQADPMYIRDSQVLNDKLYPPLGRTERPTADLLMNFINNQPDLFNMYTRGPPDTFRPIGYLTRKDGIQTIDSTLILYGRAKYQNSDIGEFYVTSSNKMSDIKIPLLHNNSNIRKITDIPNDIEIGGNILNGKYLFTELPKPDFPTPYM